VGRGGKEWVSVGEVDITTKRTGPKFEFRALKLSWDTEITT